MNLLCVLRVVEDSTSVAESIIPSLVFGFESLGGHSGESRGRSNLNETLEAMDSEEGVGSLNPSHRRGELLSKEITYASRWRCSAESRSTSFHLRSHCRDGERRSG